ncbi:hydrogen peroxide-inducible genes activator [Salaquimonas pukyongi]|uniref:hydrogen peroxide-inducible genes activator n=1 Tax=Salaquimonas pukyongi TaxID=2712698 RepID=UPI00096B96B7|nr:hydrogen peroxide-inducible genes activator [Salaquimonas pukyongi]
MKLTLRQMQYFEALARTRHFAHAAEAVHVSQPALSAQIMEMERRLGAKLFDRSRAGVYPTALAERLLPAVIRILNETKAVEEMAESSAGLLAGKLRLGIIPTIAPYVLPALVPRAAERYPQLEFEIREGLTANLVEALLAREVDLLVAALPVSDAGLEEQFLWRDNFIIAKTPGAADVLTGPIQIDEIPAQRLLLLAEGHCLRDQALDVCGLRQEGKVFNFEATSMATLVQLVSSGMGLTLLPEMAVPFENRDGALELVEFAEPCPSRDIGLVWRRGSQRIEDYIALGELITAVLASATQKKAA